MKKAQLTVLAVVGITAAAHFALAESGEKSVRARLSGFQEVPAVSTTGSGEFRGKINRTDTELTYELEYENLEGTVTQSHIHVGQRGVAGGISIFLCSNLPSPPAGTPACPTPGGKVTRTVTAADVIGPTGQGVSAGEFAEVLRALRAGVTYANVHSSKWPGGEIRGQISDEDRD